MLSELRISNFAIIDEQTVSFTPGLNVISGETGAGKSIVLEALKFILGARADTGLVRSGEEEMEVQALISLTGMARFSIEDLPEIVRDDDPKEILLTRRLSSSGRGKVFINGKLASVSLLAQVSEKLINICSQNQFMRLFEPEYHLSLIDQYAAGSSVGDFAKVSASFKQAYEKWRETKAKLDLTEQRLKQNVLRRAELQQILDDIANLELREGIKAELEGSLRREASAEKVLASGSEISGELNQEGGVFERLKKVSKLLRSASLSGAKDDPAFERTCKSFDQAESQLLQFDAEFAQFLSSTEIDEERLNEVRDKLSAIVSLERKYKTNESGLLALQREAQQELELFIDEGKLEALRKRESLEREEAIKFAEGLHQLRLKAAEELSKRVRRELAELNMKDASLSLKLVPGELRANGFDTGELLISTNRGEPLRPLRQVASGGELSRIMLVLKKLLSDRTGIHVLVFDEVDSGVSGAVARAVGEKLKGLASDSQVLCITHLPQVASLADRHILVEKARDRGKTRVKASIRVLNNEERVDEIARMLAGYTVTAASRESAKELMASNARN